ncbi:MAG: hypothetical protein WD098_07485 [Balneolales bacterium]
MDGRGYLSEEALTSFCYIFFETALDQIRFKNELLNLDDLRAEYWLTEICVHMALIPGEKSLRLEAKYVLVVRYQSYPVSTKSIREIELFRFTRFHQWFCTGSKCLICRFWQ